MAVWAIEATEGVEATQATEDLQNIWKTQFIECLKVVWVIQATDIGRS